MKRLFYLLRTPTLLIGVLVGVLLILGSCNGDKPCEGCGSAECFKSQTKFAGRIVDSDGAAISAAKVQLGEKWMLTDEKGQFCIPVEPTKEENLQYVLNVTKIGFGFASKVYQEPTDDIEVAMTKATVVENLDPSEPIVIEDEPEFTEPISADIGSPSPLDTIAFVLDSNGKLIAFGTPPEIASLYEAAAGFVADQPGGMVEVPADALVLEEGEELEGSLLQNKSERRITGSISTIDIYAPDGMPGDYSMDIDGNPAYMQTFGAIDVNFYEDGKPLKLRKGKQAKLTMPVDIITRKYFQRELPSKMRLMVYDEEIGKWKRDGNNYGILNEEGTAYIAMVDHFSVFNMDEEFTNPVCYTICAPSNYDPDGYLMEVSVPGHIKPFLPFNNDGCTTGCPSGFEAHAVALMEANSPMSVRIQEPGGTIIKTYAFLTGMPASPPIFWPNCADYPNCDGPAIIGQDCWLSSTIGGAMAEPIVAIQFAGTDIEFEWLFIEDLVAGVISNGTNYYEIEYQVQGDASNFDPAATWEKVDFDSALAQQNTFPSAAGAGTTDWNITQTVDFSGSTTATNPTLDPSTTVLLFRVNYGTNALDPASFTKGAVHIVDQLNASSMTFDNDLIATYTCTTE